MGFDCKSTSGVRRFIDAPCPGIDFFVGIEPYAWACQVEAHVPASPGVLGPWRAPTRNECVSKTLVLSPNIRTDVLDLEAYHAAIAQPIGDMRVNMAASRLATQSAAC
jgi:hypothetical protein